MGRIAGLYASPRPRRRCGLGAVRARLRPDLHLCTRHGEGHVQLWEATATCRCNPVEGRPPTSHRAIARSCARRRAWPERATCRSVADLPDIPEGPRLLAGDAQDDDHIPERVWEFVVEVNPGTVFHGDLVTHIDTTLYTRAATVRGSSSPLSPRVGRASGRGVAGSQSYTTHPTMRSSIEGATVRGPRTVSF